MGGGFVLSLASQAGAKISAAVPFYGLPSGSPDLTAVRAKVQGHYGALDEFVPLAAVGETYAAMTAAGVEAEFLTYEAGHAFYNDENLLGTYDEAAAATAWARAVAFLHAHVH